MASVFRSFLRSGHRFPCRCSNLRAQGTFLNPRQGPRGRSSRGSSLRGSSFQGSSFRGHCKRPDRHRKRLTAPMPPRLANQGPNRCDRRSFRPSVVHRAQQRGCLGRKAR